MRSATTSSWWPPNCRSDFPSQRQPLWWCLARELVQSQNRAGHLRLRRDGLLCFRDVQHSHPLLVDLPHNQLTWGFPFFLEVVVATVSMLMTYGASIFVITPTETMLSVQLRSVLSIAAFPIIVRVVIQICEYVLWKWSGGKSKFYIG
ncbi:hypothetical protein ACJRO7_018067 [Eucalyptus globulus]|uniref:Uncharacterized protein n=1 Tax=Eucalyptus globulus TaxID=34317 RepID=A0ABD3KYK7_EUCGL